MPLKNQQYRHRRQYDPKGEQPVLHLLHLLIIHGDQMGADDGDGEFHDLRRLETEDGVVLGRQIHPPLCPGAVGAFIDKRRNR